MRLHAFISGQVQGVGFRYSTRREARSLGLKGWVMNTWDGRVEVTAEGPEETVKIFLEWLREGPRFAKVDDVEYKLTDTAPSFTSFQIEF